MTITTHAHNSSVSLYYLLLIFLLLLSFHPFPLLIELQSPLKGLPFLVAHPFILKQELTSTMPPPFLSIVYSGLNLLLTSIKSISKDQLQTLLSCPTGFEVEWITIIGRHNSFIKFNCLVIAFPLRSSFHLFLDFIELLCLLITMPFIVVLRFPFDSIP